MNSVDSEEKLQGGHTRIIHRLGRNFQGGYMPWKERLCSRKHSAELLNTL
jgi:hypothetical protein